MQQNVQPTVYAHASGACSNARSFAAVFINVGRGKCVDEPALLEALGRGTIRGASLDVTADEPVKADWAGYQMDGRMLMSCHSCDVTDDMPVRAAGMFIQNLQRYMSGQALHHVVDKQAGY
jgi:phosphoglycerate dehydrogenase-like enzyme